MRANNHKSPYSFKIWGNVDYKQKKADDSVKDVPKYDIVKPEELLDETLKKITGLISQEEDTVNEIFALDLWKRIEEKALGIRLDLSTLIQIIEKCNEFDVRMKTLVEVLTVNFQVVKKFTTETKKILDALLKRWKIIKVVKSIWEANSINGDLKNEFKLLQDNVKKNISAILDCMDDKEQVLANQKFQSIGVNLKLKNTVYDYNVEKLTELEQIRHLADNKPKLKPKNPIMDGKLSGSLKRSSFGLPSTIDIDDGRRNLLQQSDLLQYEEADELLEDAKKEENVLENTINISKNIKFVGNGKISSDHGGHEKVKGRVSFSHRDGLVGKRPTSFQRFSRKDRRLFKVSDDWLDEMGENTDKANKVAEFQDTEELKSIEEEKLRYTFLAKLSRCFQTACVRIMTEMNRIDRQGNVKDRKLVQEKQEYKFVFLVDNSGSMNGEKMTLALNILVVLLESLKKMEFATAVIKFGGEESQVPLKHFNDRMDQSRGQFILEAFDSSEKTLILDAMKFVATKDELYGSRKKSNEHRFLILITDGICVQTSTEEYRRCLVKAGHPKFLVLTTLPKQSEKFYQSNYRRAESLLNQIAEGNWHKLEPEKDFMETMKDIATLIDKHLREIAQEKSTVNKDMTQERFTPFKVRVIVVFLLLSHVFS